MMSKAAFAGPGKYRIEVQGHLGPEWSRRLGAMKICARESGGEGELTILEGTVDDQAALAGILNSLYELHLPLISVVRQPDADA